MIQSIMLAAMGFVAACLLTLLMAPAFWSRAVRLTNQRLRSSLPVSEQEIRADKDLLRAEYALKVHQLEREVDQGRLAAHRQQIEINRRDIDIRRMTEALTTSEAARSEHLNARNVLEQTVSTRIPQLESALGETRRHLDARDAAFMDLQATADSQAAALEDGRAIMTQRALEVQRLQALFQEASASHRDRRADGGTEGDMALRAEIESLKARLAERSAVIERLQNQAAAQPRNVAAYSHIEGDDESIDTWRARAGAMSAEIRLLNERLIAKSSLNATSAAALPDSGLSTERLQQLEVQIRAQSDEISRLRNEADAVVRASDPTANARVRESKIWLRARIDRIEGELEQERKSTARLRAELAAGNERIARQAAQFRDDLRRYGNRQSTGAAQVLRRADGEAGRSGQPQSYGRRATDAVPAPRSLTARAREMQEALHGHFGPATGEGVPPETALVLENHGLEKPQAAVATEPTVNGGSSPDQQQRAGLLDRLRGYEQV
jgi:hypothetical protein